MKILQIASSWSMTPPRIYGPVEQLTGDLSEELVRLGHDVTLFATADSQTSATLAYELAEGVGEYEREKRIPLAKRHAQAAIEYANAHDFDIVSNHETYHCIYLCLQLRHPHVTRMGWLGDQRMEQYIRGLPHHEFQRFQFISVSQRQQQVMPYLNWIGNIYNGRCLEQFAFQEQKGHFLLFLGRVTEDKGPDRAIRVAQKTGIPLIIAGIVPAYSREYFEVSIKPHIDNRHIQWLGPADQTLKKELLTNAMALLMPISWEEPSGNVMVEAMASGTPVIAFRAGSAPEIVIHGETGFLVDTLDEMILACHQLHTIQPRRCREHVEKYFSVQVMAQNYLALYHRVLETGKAVAKTEISYVSREKND